jgi:hypothetical protein
MARGVESLFNKLCELGIGEDIYVTASNKEIENLRKALYRQIRAFKDKTQLPWRWRMTINYDTEAIMRIVRLPDETTQVLHEKGETAEVDG